MTRRARFSHRRPGQQGAVLFVAMVVLVALALAALALLRSTDVAGLIASNLSFKRSALGATDQGYLAAKQAIDLLTAANRNAGLATSCYSATQLPVDTRGVPSVLTNTSTFDTSFPGCKLTNSYNSTETIRYVSDRLCSQTGIVYETDCVMSQLPGNSANAGGNAALITTTAAYRVTVRVDSLRNTTSFSQIIAK